MAPMSQGASLAAPPAGQGQRGRRRSSRGSGRGSDSDTPEPVAYPPSPTARPDRITYGSLIAALERGGQWERALAVFEDMQAQGIQARRAAWVVGSIRAGPRRRARGNFPRPCCAPC